MSARNPVRRFLAAQLVCIFLAALAIGFVWGKLGLISVAIGGAVAMMNVVGTAFAWPRLLEKKDVALALSIIVSKFALSIGIFYWLTTPSFETFWAGDNAIALGSVPGTFFAFALGLSSVVPSALIIAICDFWSKKD